MATIQSGTSPGRRVKAGKLVLARAVSVDTTSVKRQVDGLRSANGSYEKAHHAASVAAARLAQAEAVVGERDVTQDASLDTFAAAHIVQGASRVKPLADYKAGSVSDIKVMPAEKQAKLLLKLATKGKASTDAGVKRAAVQLEKAATAVLKAIAPIEGWVEKRNEAIAARDALAPRWEKAFATLKRAVRAAEDEGAEGLFEALFEITE